MSTKSILLTLCLCLQVSSIALAQRTQVARVTFLKPKNQFGPELANGYKKHLEWHKQAADPWTWYVWQVISGEDVGTLVDVAVVHWGDLNKQVDPSADLADFNAKVAPEASEGRIELWSLPAQHSRTFDQPTRFMVLGRLHVSEGEVGVSKSSAQTSRPCILLPRADRNGDREIIVLCSAKDWEEVSNGLEALSSFARALHARASHSEVLRYRQDLLYAPAR